MEEIKLPVRSSVVQCTYIRSLGQGFWNQYKECLAYELNKAGLLVEKEKKIPFQYEGTTFDSAYRLDLLVENKIIIETKAVEEISDVHLAQILTYLRLSKKQVGLLLNFNVVVLKDGIKRVVNGY